MSQDEPSIDGHLRVDGLSHDLKRRSTRSGALMITSFAIQLIIGVGGTAILARLLHPRDFGYLAMVMVLINFTIPLREFLLSPVVYQQELSHAQASGLFWINGVASILVAAAIAACGPLLVWFFKEPRLLAITLAMSAGFMINMLSMLHVGLLRRQMRFAAITSIEISAALAGTIVAVVMAWLGAGYWALVVQQLVIWVWQTAATWIACPWRAASYRSSNFHGDADVRAMLHYGKDTTASRLVQYVGRNTDAMLVGHFAGATILGLYQKAYQWAMMAFWQIYLPMTPVAVASFSRLQQDPQRYRLYVRTSLLGLFGLSLPAMALLTIESDAVVGLFLGSQWIDAIPMLRVLSVAAFFSSFATVTNWVYLPEGRTREQLFWSMASSPLIMLSVAIGIHWGAVGVAYGTMIASILLVAPSVWYCLRRSPLSARDFLLATWRAAVASIIAAIALALLRRVLPPLPNLFERFVLHCVIYGAIYLISWLALPGGCRAAMAILRQFPAA